MELLQSQAPVEQELSVYSLDIRHGTKVFGNIEEKLFLEGTKRAQ